MWTDEERHCNNGWNFWPVLDKEYPQGIEAELNARMEQYPMLGLADLRDGICHHQLLSD